MERTQILASKYGQYGYWDTAMVPINKVVALLERCTAVKVWYDNASCKAATLNGNGTGPSGH